MSIVVPLFAIFAFVAVIALFIGWEIADAIRDRR